MSGEGVAGGTMMVHCRDDGPSHEGDWKVAGPDNVAEGGLVGNREDVGNVEEPRGLRGCNLEIINLLVALAIILVLILVLILFLVLFALIILFDHGGPYYMLPHAAAPHAMFTYGGYCYKNTFLRPYYHFPSYALLSTLIPTRPQPSSFTTSSGSPSSLLTLPTLASFITAKHTLFARLLPPSRLSRFARFKRLLCAHRITLRFNACTLLVHGNPSSAFKDLLVSSYALSFYRLPFLTRASPHWLVPFIPSAPHS
ncbi:hypothetical protein BDR07DRAFT_1492095 [Suillus spraguei]|nr:hypothetical protein BDR07DRAFT_1492095 [Suillus spraguei]